MFFRVCILPLVSFALVSAEGLAQVPSTSGDRMVLGPPQLGSAYDRVESMAPSQRSGQWSPDEFLRKSAYAKGGRRTASWGSRVQGSTPRLGSSLEARGGRFGPAQYTGNMTGAEALGQEMPCVYGANEACGGGIPVEATPRLAAYLADKTCYHGLDGWVCTRYEIPVIEHTVTTAAPRQFASPGSAKRSAPVYGPPLSANNRSRVGQDVGRRMGPPARASRSATVAPGASF